MKDIITIKKLSNIAEADILDREFSHRYRWNSQGYKNNQVKPGQSVYSLGKIHTMR